MIVPATWRTVTEIALPARDHISLLMLPGNRDAGIRVFLLALKVRGRSLLPASTAADGGTMQSRIVGTTMPVLELLLEPGESVKQPVALPVDPEPHHHRLAPFVV